MKNCGPREKRPGRYGKLRQLFSGVYDGKTVLVTGHTGFKGAWLALWLKMLGARVVGYAMPAPTQPALFNELRLGDEIDSVIGDIRDAEALQQEFACYNPEIVFHLAAQPLVRLSYDQPVETFSTNVMGTVNLLEAVRRTPSVRACICVTSDKCYENREWPYAYRENDPMGGHDPYSASKGCAELVTASWRRSFFAAEKNEQHRVLLASARAGNVIGGGDWALDRIVPDAVRALSLNEAIPVRNPGAIRPWQHVLEPLAGYLQLAASLLTTGPAFADAWNFGPLSTGAVNVREIVDKIIGVWGEGSVNDLSSGQKQAPHEANFLKLDCSKAVGQLGWRPVLSVDEAIELTASWYQRYYRDKNFPTRSFTESQIDSYAQKARVSGVTWAGREGS